MKRCSQFAFKICRAFCCGTCQPENNTEKVVCQKRLGSYGFFYHSDHQLQLKQLQPSAELEKKKVGWKEKHLPDSNISTQLIQITFK